MSLWRIAVLSDTHDRYPPDLPARLEAANEIWHLGDVCDPSVLVEFERKGRPLLVVRGNCDSEERWPWELVLERAGSTFLLTHIPPAAAPPGVTTILHGHTHVPREETRDGVRWLNPGCVSRPRGTRPGFAWLTLETGRPAGWKPVAL